MRESVLRIGFSASQRLPDVIYPLLTDGLQSETQFDESIAMSASVCGCYPKTLMRSQISRHKPSCED
jgi:hypothetical protein